MDASRNAWMRPLRAPTLPQCTSTCTWRSPSDKKRFSFASLPQVLDLHRLDRLGQLVAEDLRIEVQFRLQGALDVLGFTEAVLLAGKGQVGHGDALGLEGGEHALSLGGRHDPVLQALQQDDRRGEPVDVVDGRARLVDGASGRVAVSYTHL